MHRNLDLVSLRTLIAVAETGGMTRAANLLHMTQSAVSMQMKRLEEQLSVRLLRRDGRKVIVTVEGDRLISYARRLLEINNEALRSLNEPLYDATITCGVSSDIVHPFLPKILQSFQSNYPRLGINLENDYSHFLRRGLKNGIYDIILTTELAPAEGGVVLTKQPLVWMGNPDGNCWRTRPLPVALSHNCMFRKPVLETLDNVGIDWLDVAQSMNDDSALVVSAADMGVRAELAFSCVHGISEIKHEGELPDLPDYCVVIYCSPGLNRDIADEFCQVASRVFSAI